MPVYTGLRKPGYAMGCDATSLYVESFGDGLVVIMGGRYKGGDFAEVFVEVEEFGVEDEQVGAPGVRRPLVFLARREMVCTSTPIFSAHSRTRCLKASGDCHMPSPLTRLYLHQQREQVIDG